MQDEEQAEGPSRHEMGTATRNVEEASSTQKSGSNMRGGACDEPERDVYGGGAGPTGVTKTDGGARLTVVEGVVLRKASIGETTSECRNNDRGARELPPEAWEERDCETNAY